MKISHCGGALMLLILAAIAAMRSEAATFALGTTALLEGPAAGSDSVVLVVTPETGAWTASANVSWLHLTATNQSGTGSTNVIFSYDANPGATRYGTLTIGDQTLAVTQAGATYVAVSLPARVLAGSGLYHPSDLAVDGAGNVCIADTGNSAIKRWMPANNTVTTLVSFGLSTPGGVAADAAGNVYIADYGNSAIKKWTAASNTVTTLVSSGLNLPVDVAVDGAGNVYISDTYNNAVRKWTAASNSVTTLVSSGLNHPEAMAVDAAGNVYFVDTGNSAVKKWTAASSNVTTLVSSLFEPSGVAVDGGGNVYVGVYGVNSVRKWTAASNTVNTLVWPGLNGPGAVAVDGAGNIYILDGNLLPAMKEMTHAFVDPTPKLEDAGGGTDTLPAVLPNNVNLLPPFAPASDQSWLTITGITNGVVSFAFTANSSANRTARITLLDKVILVTQFGTYGGRAGHWEGPAGGSDSIALVVNPATAAWTATANDSWLHFDATNQNGTGGTNVVFTYDANAGATRTGTLNVGGHPVTVVQAGSTYVAAPGPATTLFSAGLNFHAGLAVDGDGNVYLADSSNNAVKMWTAANNTVTTLVSSGLNGPRGVALDGASNVYIADYGNNAIKMWTATNNTVTTLVSNGLSLPMGVAVDWAGNVYIAAYGNSAVQKWWIASNTVTTLIPTGLNHPTGVAVDWAGNLFIADYGNNAIKKWSAANGAVTTLVASGLSHPLDVALDSAGNVYIADADNQAIKKWSAAGKNVTTLVPGLNRPGGVAVDVAGNVYFADVNTGMVGELPHAFVDPTAKSESYWGGGDALPVILPETENLLPPFAPSSDQPWLTVGGLAGGVVSLNLAANTGASRTGHVTLLGRAVPVVQAGAPVLIGAKMLGDGTFQFAFSNNDANASFTVLCTTNLSVPLDGWTVAGMASNVAPGLFQFAAPPNINDSQRFFCVRTP